MPTDPAVRQEAHNHLLSLFQGIGRQAQGGPAPSALAGMGGQLEEFLAMPLDLAQLFAGMAVDLTELVLRSLEEGGIILVKGMTPM